MHAETREVLAGARERLRDLVDHLPGDRLPLLRQDLTEEEIRAIRGQLGADRFPTA